MFAMFLTPAEARHGTAALYKTETSLCTAATTSCSGCPCSDLDLEIDYAVWKICIGFDVLKRWSWIIPHSGIYRHRNLRKWRDVSEDGVVSMFRVNTKPYKKRTGSVSQSWLGFSDPDCTVNWSWDTLLNSAWPSLLDRRRRSPN
jgi:hypothetical protein